MIRAARDYCRRANVDAAHARLCGERDERRGGLIEMALADTELLGEHHDRAALGRLVRQRRELRRVGHLLLRVARERQELGGLPVAEGDRAGRRLQLDHVKDAAVHQAKVAVYVADCEAEYELYKVLVRQADEDAVQRVLALDFPSVDNVHARAQCFEQHLDLARVILRVAVRVKDPFLGRLGKAAAQHAAVAARLRPVLIAKFARVKLAQFIQDHPGVVTAAVVDDQDFIIIRDLAQDLDRAHDHDADGPGIIVTGKENRDGWFLIHFKLKILCTGWVTQSLSRQLQSRVPPHP